jgi:hypothetical protein
MRNRLAQTFGSAQGDHALKATVHANTHDIEVS